MSKERNSFNWAKAFRDIVVTSINKGQLPLLGVIAIVLLILHKTPESEFKGIFIIFAERLGTLSIVAYLGFVIFPICWYYHTKQMRKHFSREFERIGKEKSEWQEIATGKKLKSSNKK